MNARVKELQHFSDRIAWLSPERASVAYSVVHAYDSRVHYGLNSSTVKHIERIEFEGNSVDVASAWLRGRLPTDEKLVVVFGEKDCFECASGFFLEAWQDIFCPSRDDAIVYSEQSPFILFYCHEDEIEVGQRVL